MRGPLDGLLILDLSRVLAAPLASQLLGDAGARVIKIEDPHGGDPTRGWGPPFVGTDAAYYRAFNRNKESVACDLKSERGRELVRRIAARADVVIENFGLGKAEELGVGYGSLAAANSGLIYAAVTGFGAEGPEARVPGFDFLVQAMAGWMSITGPANEPPTKAGLPLVDIVAGLSLYGAITTALFARQRTGRGEKIEVSLFGAAVAALGNVAHGWFAGGGEPARWGNAHPQIVPYETLRAADRSFALAIGTDAQWRRFCERVLERPELAEASAFPSNRDRVARRAELIPRLERELAKRPAGEWIARCRREGIPAGEVRTVPETLTGEQAAADRLVVDLGGRPALAPWFRFAGGGIEPRRNPPALGQDTERIEAEFGPAVVGVRAPG